MLSGEWNSYTSCEILFWLLFCSFSVFSLQLHCINNTLKDNSAWLSIFPCLPMSLGSICKPVVRSVWHLNIIELTILLSFPCPFLCLDSFFFQKEIYNKFTKSKWFLYNLLEDLHQNSCCRIDWSSWQWYDALPWGALRGFFFQCQKGLEGSFLLLIVVSFPNFYSVPHFPMFDTIIEIYIFSFSFSFLSEKKEKKSLANLHSIIT